MKVTSFFIVFLFCIHSLFSQQPARLVVRGDDMGYSHSGNIALVKCFQEGIEKSIEVIVPSPWFPEAVELLKKIPNADIGVHLALTSEWDNVKWRPLTDCSSLKDSNGYFFPMVFPNKNYPGKSIKENDWKIEDVEKEFRAQIEMAKKYIPNLTHLSGHMGCTDLNFQVTELTTRLAKEYGIEVDFDKHQVKNMSYGKGPTKTSAEKVSSFIRELGNLKPGNTYMFVDHPGIDGPELRAIHHVGYENVAQDRQGVTDLFTSPAVKAAVKKNNIQLISYKDLK